MSPDDTNTNKNRNQPSAAREAGTSRPPPGHRPAPLSSSSSDEAATEDPKSVSTKPPKVRRPKAQLDAEAMKRKRAEVEAEADRTAEERKKVLERAAELERQRAKKSTELRRLQKDYARQVALQDKRLRKRGASLGAQILEELGDGERGRKLWAQLKPYIEKKDLAPDVDTHFRELRELEALQKALKA